MVVRCRFALVIAVALSSIFVGVTPGHAWITVDNDGIPTSDGFYFETIPLAGINVTSLTGNMQIQNPACKIGLTVSNCLTTITLRSLPNPWFTGGTDICSSDVYQNEGQAPFATLPADCSLQDHPTTAPVTAGVATGKVDAIGCSYWSFTWIPDDSNAYYADKQARGLSTANVALKLWGTITLNNNVPGPIGDSWTIGMDLKGSGKSQNPTNVFTADFTIEGAGNSGVNCRTYSQVSDNFNITSGSGGAVVSHV